MAWKNYILVVLLALTQLCAPLPLVDSGDNDYKFLI